MGASATGCEWVAAGRWEVKPHPAAVTSTPTCSFGGRESHSGDTHLLSLPGKLGPLRHSREPPNLLRSATHMDAVPLLPHQLRSSRGVKVSPSLAAYCRA